MSRVNRKASAVGAASRGGGPHVRTVSRLCPYLFPKRSPISDASGAERRLSAILIAAGHPARPVPSARNQSLTKSTCAAPQLPAQSDSHTRPRLPKPFYSRAPLALNARPRPGVVARSSSVASLRAVALCEDDVTPGAARAILCVRHRRRAPEPAIVALESLKGS